MPLFLKWLFLYSEMDILSVENNSNTIHCSKIDFLGCKKVTIDEKYFFILKMAISVSQNGHFEEMGA